MQSNHSVVIPSVARNLLLVPQGNQRRICHSEPARHLVFLTNWFAPICRQIFPSGILALNQSDLLRSRPFLDLSLSRDAIIHIFENFKIDQPVNLVTLGENCLPRRPCASELFRKVRQSSQRITVATCWPECKHRIFALPSNSRFLAALGMTSS